MKTLTRQFALQILYRLPPSSKHTRLHRAIASITWKLYDLGNR